MSNTLRSSTGTRHEAIDGVTDVTPRMAARIAGVGYVILFLLGIFANFFVLEGLVEPGDATATAANIVESETLFRLGLLGFMVVFVVDVVVAWALYIVFRAVNRDLSLLTAWFRLVYSVFLGVALVFSFQVLQLLSGADYLKSFDGDQLDAQVLGALESFNYTWLIGLVCFGIHLVLLGLMILKSGNAPKMLGYLLVVAGAAYAIDTVGYALLANYGDYENGFLVMVAVPSVIGELWLGLWLLLKAGKPREAL